MTPEARPPMTPEARPPYLEISWHDETTGCRGYLVIDRLVRGLSSGGLRMRAGCTLDEVRRLAAGMSVKEALHYDPSARYIPLGGAKGGIDWDPRREDARDILRRYLLAIRPYLEQYWTAGEDLGLTQDLLDEVCHEIGLESSVQAVYPVLPDRDRAIQRLRTAFDTTSDGVPLDGLVGGYGVASAALRAMELHGQPIAGTRAVVQGFGSMGGATARYLARAGVRVTGVCDVRGFVHNTDGLDVETLLAARDRLGTIDRAALRASDEDRPADEWLGADVDLLVPAAISDCITEENQQAITARFIAEAANLPVTPAAEEALLRRGAVIVPDVVANSGTNSWWWWTLFGDIEPTVDSAFAKIDTAMRALVTEMFQRAERDGCSPRSAALAIASDHLREIVRRFPVHR